MMKLGIIIRPEPEEMEKAKALGLDFVELDLNYPAFFGCPMSEIWPKLPALKAAQEKTGMEVGAVGRWASHILDANGEIIPEEW
ncbi:MAG: hypothetical protein RSC76_04565, partial [Oscillospiraceae bacterium]